MTDYNYDTFSPDDYDFDSSAGPEVGQKAPDFELETAEGETQKLLTFDGDFLVLELGSITCPLFHTRREGMQSIESEFPSVSFAVLYVREAHPGEDIPAHQQFEEKKACAARLSSEEGDKRKILVDGLEGAAHEAYGSMPNSIFIIDKEGIVKFKAEWSNPTATRKALRALIDGEEVRVKSYFRPAKPSIVLRTVKRAGKGSKSDFFRGLPRLIWNNIVKRNIKTLFKKI